MSAQHQSTVARSSVAELPFGSGYEAFGCTVNKISVEDLFSRYEECGFLYPTKRDRLTPYLPLIVENWRRSMSVQSGQFLHDVVVFENPSTGAWASVTYWATTSQTVHSQHLVSVGFPEASRAVLLSAQSASHNYGHAGSQNWFRAKNRYPARIFGSCTASLGQESAAVHEYSCVAVCRDCVPPTTAAVQVHCVTDADAQMMHSLASRLCGSVQAEADEWTVGDPGLANLDERYKRAGLRRFRRVFIATVRGLLDPVGMAIAYRGPLGLNFSFLENRCELWLDPELDQERRVQTIGALVNAAADIYRDFELSSMLLTSDMRTGEALVCMGAQPMQDYMRSVWLRSGYSAWYSHVNGFYSRIDAAVNHRTIPACNGNSS